MRYVVLLIVTSFLFLLVGCQNPVMNAISHRNGNVSVSQLAKLSTDIQITSVAASSALWPDSNAIDGDTATDWSSNVDPSVNSTEWIAYWFSNLSFHNVNYIEVYPRYGTNGALGFPVKFDIYWSNGSSWVLASSYTSYPNPTGGWVVFPFDSLVSANGIKIVATQLGVDNYNNPVFQLGEVEAGYNGVNRIVCINDSVYGPPIFSTYSPWVMHESGWDRYRMYFGRNEIINGVAEDRIYLSENFGDGETGWGTPILLLSPGGSGESALIHDPTVTIVGSTWNMYYTGTDGPDANGHYNNQIFHATSSDGVNWTKQGVDSISGLPLQDGPYGYGEPSILYENGTYYLYFYSDATPTDSGTVYLATGTDGQNFTYYERISNVVMTSPEVRQYGSEYILVGCSGFTRILEQVSGNPTSFGSSYSEIYSTGPLGSWDYYHVGTPDILPNEGKLYYAGTTNYWEGASQMDDGKIGVANVTF